jgi:hypothetical protein
LWSESRGRLSWLKTYALLKKEIIEKVKKKVVKQGKESETKTGRKIRKGRK